MYPTDRRYTKEHEWILVDGDTGRIGITDYAQDQLGDIVYVELPEVGRQVEQQEVMGTIESVKAVSELYAPVAGEIVEANDALEDKPEGVNQDPHGEGWYCKIKLADPAEVDALMDAAAYEELIGSL
jgi:glycine cleavage system H protein